MTEAKLDELHECERIAEEVFSHIQQYISPKILYNYLYSKHRGYLISRFTHDRNKDRNKGKGKRGGQK